LPELRKDMIRGHWVALATDRALKPNDFPIAQKNMIEGNKTSFCPFCEGHESETPPEVDAFRDHDSEANVSGWKVRVFPNKFSAFDTALDLNPHTEGIFPVMNGVGIHEVIVETPKHDRGWQDYSEEEIYTLLQMYQRRYAAVAKDERVRYIQIYKNYGLFAGASLEHNHSQLIGFPFVPNTFEGFSNYYQQKGHCLLCDLLQQECTNQERIVYEGEHFVLLCPYASRFAYETWLVPKTHRQHFQNLPEEEVREMAHILRMYVPHMFELLNHPSYNLMIHAGCVNPAEKADSEHWYMEIIPRLMVQAGVEVASGVYMNPVAPECAASILREGLK